MKISKSAIDFSEIFVRPIGDTRFPNLYTLRTFGGLGPLWGIGVTSLMERMLKPWLMSDRMAESRPLPMPFTTTLTSFGPVFWIFSTIAAITFEEANGVAFFGPEKPSDPADAQATTLPLRSVTVTTVLL